MKLITMMTLLLTDADVIFSMLGAYTFLKAKKWALSFIVWIGALVYLGGAIVAYHHQWNFVKLFKEKVGDGRVTEFDNDDVQHLRTPMDFFQLCKSWKGKGDASDPESSTLVSSNVLYIYYAERRQFRRTIVTFAHSLPFFRMMRFAWQQDIQPADFAGLLNANGLWSFTCGLLMQGCSIWYTINVEWETMVMASISIGCLTTVMSLLNIVLDFPGQLGRQEQEKSERLQLETEAERATRHRYQQIEKIVRDREQIIFEDEKTGLKADPLGAVMAQNEEVKKYQAAKKMLLVNALQTLKDNYQMKKEAYEKLLSLQGQSNTVPKPSV